MPRKAEGSAPLTPAQRQARKRADRAAYIADLEAAVRDACVMSIPRWLRKYGQTIARAHIALEKGKPK